MIWSLICGPRVRCRSRYRRCGLSGKMLVWQRPDAGRWLALAVGQADPEFPIQLLAAVGEVPIPAVADL
ncbi:hypothetical protein GCM10022416_04320 [Actinomadura keratinilytica]|uniref:Uncharacterized protein n=1 Tax=Actinomadura keratinilytica TaxID=547461 RepID=A0ABP7XZR9_9ACTN